MLSDSSDQPLPCVSFYDRFASTYELYRRTRLKYLRAIDVAVTARAPRQARMLDIGSADGVRAMSLAKAIDARSLQMLDLSRGMAGENHACLIADIADLSSLSPLGTFDVITCLGNVLGHVETPYRRRQALTNMAHLLAPNGRLFIDVHNRYNFRAYGLMRVLRNFAADVVRFRKPSGDFPLRVSTTTGTLLTTVHIFAPWSFLAYFAMLDCVLPDNGHLTMLVGGKDGAPSAASSFSKRAPRCASCTYAIDIALMREASRPLLQNWRSRSL